ncbi:Transcription factor GTE4 [Striga hermonthica]|uniref:Transcription factor GTE4 n=1 Tax=Striga hermonthica TaxID=68872 RepID=A0A9N7NLI5_STRHE|nr:Transcription factor GTE4 [Striga hermonthica]
MLEQIKSGDGKVYCRRSPENSKGSSDLLRGQTIVSEGLNPTRTLHASGFDMGSDNFSGLSRVGSAVRGGFLRQENQVRIDLSMTSKRHFLELRRKLEAEREMVRSLMSKIEANENEVRKLIIRNADKVAMGMGPSRTVKPVNQSIKQSSVGKVGKEKRTPKVNKLYRNSEFLLAKDKIPHVEGNKRLKSKGEGGSGLGMQNFSINQAFKSCSALLERLMKHKHAWVFNTPVDAVGLGLHDYFEIIKNPMDLGTVKNRLTQSWYKSPVEFAEDVRLTFRNAMTYNPKEQDVHLMADLLSKLFEDKWAPIEADYRHEMKLASDFHVGLPMPMAQKSLPPSQSRAKPDMKLSVDTDPKRKTMGAVQSGKVPSPKKPKAKDSDKREMTYEEKQKLSVNLQNLPSEKLENVVQIIKKRNPSVSQQDDEIEFDIDSVDAETLWELDRFITNYKTSLSNNKREAENVSQIATDLYPTTKENITSTVQTETPKESRTDEVRAVITPVEVEGPQCVNTNKEANHSSSSSDTTRSSSRDSDVESSSADGSDGKHSPNN